MMGIASQKNDEPNVCVTYKTVFNASDYKPSSSCILFGLVNLPQKKGHVLQKVDEIFPPPKENPFYSGHKRNRASAERQASISGPRTMLPRQSYRRFCSLLTLALVRESAPIRHSFSVASAFSPSFRSASYHCPSTSSLTSATVIMLSDKAKQTNVMPLSYLETPTDGSERKQPDGSPLAPPILLVHGLDSSSHTWRSILDDLGATGHDAVAVDQRGCGTSPLGDPNRFSPDALVDDLYALVSSHPYFLVGGGTGDADAAASVVPFVLVGHSMGGRVAMSFAAKHPECIAALVVEDMDVRQRFLSESHVRSKNRDATVAFDRSLPGASTPEDVVGAFAREGYPRSQVEKWLSEGRVEPTAAGDDGGGGSSYFSQVNPAFRLLCYEQFFETNHGEDTWKKIAAAAVADEAGRNLFPIHLMIADPTMTICDEESVSIMKDAMEGTKPTVATASSSSSSSHTPLTVHRYPNATHSIHNSAREEFMIDLKAIIEEARAQRA